MKTISISKIRNLVINQNSTIIRLEIIKSEKFSKTTESLSYNSTLWYKKYVNVQPGDIVLDRGNKKFNLSEIERIMKHHINDTVYIAYSLNDTFIGTEGVLAE